MKRKEQEARIEQQRQEKEKAREDAARERARYEELHPLVWTYTHMGLHHSSFSSSCPTDE